MNLTEKEKQKMPQRHNDTMIHKEFYLPYNLVFLRALVAKVIFIF
jgi:hypothetical protein